MGTIYRNGKVNTIIKNGKIYGYASKSDIEILKGTTTPTLAQGNNGEIYLKYNNIISDLEKITNTSDNTYISINEQGNKNTKFVIKCNIHGGGSFATPIGSRKAINNDNLVLFFKYEGSNNARYAVHNGDTAFGNVSNFFDTDITITLSNELVKIEDENGNYIEQIPTNTNDFSTYNMMLFNLGTSDSTIYGSSTACYMDLYECKIYKNNVLTRYLLPKTENNVIGLIDIFDGTFYSANGTVTGTSRSVPLSFIPITNTYLKVNNTWQNLIGSDIDDVGNTSKIVTPIDMSNITKVGVTSSMNYIPYYTSIISTWNSGSAIAANGYVTVPIDVTNINKIYYNLETKNCWGNGSQAEQLRWNVMIGLMQTPITSSVEVPFDEAGFAAGEDFAYSNTNYGTQEIDVSNLTGNYYFTFVSHGWNASISNLRYE